MLYRMEGLLLGLRLGSDSCLVLGGHGHGHGHGLAVQCSDCSE